MGQVCFGCLTPTLKVVELILAQPQNICKEFFEALGPFRKAGESCLNQTKKKKGDAKVLSGWKEPPGLGSDLPLHVHNRACWHLAQTLPSTRGGEDNNFRK